MGWVKYRAISVFMYFLAFLAIIDGMVGLTILFVVIGIAFWKYGTYQRGNSYIERDIRRSARNKSAFDKIFYDEYNKYR